MLHVKTPSGILGQPGVGAAQCSKANPLRSSSALAAARFMLMLLLFVTVAAATSASLYHVSGEEPCDEVDACCKQHDDCVGGSSVLDSECHTDFVACLDQVMLSGSNGFSKKVRPNAADVSQPRQGAAVSQQVQPSQQQQQQLCAEAMHILSGVAWQQPLPHL
jgi:hypothetical protein